MTSFAAFTQGLYPFEVVLLVGGILLFLVLLIGLVAGLVRGKISAILVPLFILSLAMIGWPSVQSIQYNHLTVTLNNQLQQVAANPADQAARSRLAQITAQLASRPGNAATLTAVASAQYALGQEGPAQQNLARALQMDPRQPAALALKSKIDAVTQMRQLAHTVQSNPSDVAAKLELEEVAARVSQMPLANPRALVSLAVAQKLTGNGIAAQQTEKKALAISPHALKTPAP
ncbi:MAG: hypothetical protein QJR10_07500 [Bacillota bacterium]|nr:hypothetical protein [Bacillota bacterium]